MSATVKIWQEQIELPTYLTGKQDTHPMFLAHRVYQGSSGAVYPYGVTDTLTGEKTLRPYQALYLENDYLRIMLLPELGGRVHRAWDKVKQRDFVYYNEVVKPALVGLLGPWISGGIEFNWPQHHRPTTYMPVDFTLQPGENGAQTVWLGEVEPMHGLQVMTGFTLYPDKALLEISARIYNANPTPRHFLWWANPAVKGGDDHQSVFPPDVTAVFDHGKRDVSSFPIATGTYYKVDYSRGVDISRYKNIPVPTSYMADKSAYDFVGAYSHDEQGGLLHVADHHISPGKKQWTWGNCAFGKAWDRNLTDRNGPYIELMTGVFTDNQPDFTWLDAYEEKRFVQNFMPYSGLGTVQNANTDAVIKLERNGRQLEWGVYAVGPLPRARVMISSPDGGEGLEDQLLVDREITLRPGDVLTETLAGEFAPRLTLRLLDSRGRELLAYTEHLQQETPLPQPAQAPLPAGEIACADEAWFIGQHLEQYHHASRSALDYYRRGVELDPGDYRCNLALATLAYNRADFAGAIAYANTALRRAHRLNKNPQCGLASLIRACAREQLDDFAAAYEDFFRAVWSGNAKSAGYFGLARLATRRDDYAAALDFCGQGLASQARHYGLVALKALLLSLTGQPARAYIDRQLAHYPLHYLLHYLRYRQEPDDDARQVLLGITGGRGENALNIATQLLSFGRRDLALDALRVLDCRETLPLYLQASLDPAAAESLSKRARLAFPAHVRFPNSPAEVNMLSGFTHDAFAQHLLASFHYSKGNISQAVAHWQRCLQQEPDFADAWRGLGIYAWNKQHDAAEARRCLDAAFKLNPQDARLLFELDLLHKLTQTPPQTRLELLEAHLPVALQRDDLTAELLCLYNLCGKLDAASALLTGRRFHPWEGGEGRVTGQYVLNAQLQALSLLAHGNAREAQARLLAALDYPPNLGEGRLVGQTDNDLYYWLGACARQLRQDDQARGYFARAAAGERDLGERRYYNDRPVDYLFYQGMALRRLNQHEQADALFADMLAWSLDGGRQPPETDFFAVSLPDLLVLDADRQNQQREHRLLVKALARLGAGDDAYSQTLREVLVLNPANSQARFFLQYGDAVGVY